MDNWAYTGKMVKGKTIKTEEKKSFDIFLYSNIKNLTNRFAHSRVDEKRAETATLNIFMYRRPTLYPLEIAVDFLKSL